MTDSPRPHPADLPVGKDGIIRRGFGLKAEITGQLNEDYYSGIVQTIREAGNTWEVEGLVFRLANHFGFCYGVDKAIDFAYETHRKFPDRRIFLTAEIIHNPRVNKRMLDLGIRFLSGQYADGATIDEIRPEDVVLLPAFGVDTGLLEQLRVIGCILVDSTCGSVVHVWKRVEKYAKDDYTSIIHGKWWHEETVATASHARMHNDGKHLVVLTEEDAQVVCDFIRDGEPPQCVADLERRFADSRSEGFDFSRDLKRVGVANQTTMLSSESLHIAGMFRQAMIDRYGAETEAEHFRSFDTICSATQERQDAVLEMMQNPPDLMIVVGGFNSSNTSHLKEIASAYCPTYHVDDAARLISPQRIEHKPTEADAEPVVTNDWLPSRRPVTIGLTAGASTPNKVVGEIIELLVAWESTTAEIAPAR